MMVRSSSGHSWIPAARQPSFSKRVDGRKLQSSTHNLSRTPRMALEKVLIGTEAAPESTEDEQTQDS